jgi:hypothetical protein
MVEVLEPALHRQLTNFRVRVMYDWRVTTNQIIMVLRPFGYHQSVRHGAKALEVHDQHFILREGGN